MERYHDVQSGNVVENRGYENAMNANEFGILVDNHGSSHADDDEVSSSEDLENFRAF